MNLAACLIGLASGLAVPLLTMILLLRTLTRRLEGRHR